MLVNRVIRVFRPCACSAVKPGMDGVFGVAIVDCLLKGSRGSAVYVVRNAADMRFVVLR